MRKTLILAGLLAIGALSGCKHYCDSNPYPIIVFTNFDSAALNTVILKMYDPNMPGITEPGTFVYTSRASTSLDTLHFYKREGSSLPYIYLGFGKNATVEIPATGKTYTITGITVHHDTWESVNCTNSMDYYLDGQKINQPMQPNRNMEGVISISQ